MNRLWELCVTILIVVNGVTSLYILNQVNTDKISMHFVAIIFLIAAASFVWDRIKGTEKEVNQHGN